MVARPTETAGSRTKITCHFFVITCNITRSPGGEFLSAVVFGRRGIFVGEGFWQRVFFLAGGGFCPEGGFNLDPDLPVRYVGTVMPDRCT